MVISVINGNSKQVVLFLGVPNHHYTNNRTIELLTVHWAVA